MHFLLVSGNDNVRANASIQFLRTWKNHNEEVHKGFEERVCAAFFQKESVELSGALRSTSVMRWWYSIKEINFLMSS